MYGFNAVAESRPLLIHRQQGTPQMVSGVQPRDSDNLNHGFVPREERGAWSSPAQRWALVVHSTMLDAQEGVRSLPEYHFPGKTRFFVPSPKAQASRRMEPLNLHGTIGGLTASCWRNGDLQLSRIIATVVGDAANTYCGARFSALTTSGSFRRPRHHHHGDPVTWSIYV